MYLLDLAEGSRPAVPAALNTIAGALTKGANLEDIAWHALTLKHTAAICSWLMTAHNVWDKETKEYRPFKPAHANWHEACLQLYFVGRLGNAANGWRST